MSTVTLNIAEYNNRCAEFLGYKNTTPDDKDFNIYMNEKGMIIGNKIYTMLETMSMRFHSDWNWIMNVVDAIEEAGSSVIMDIEIKGNFLISRRGINFYFSPKNEYLLHLEIKPFLSDYVWKHSMYKNHIIKEFNFKNNTKMDAVVYAIDQFLIWYFSNKK